jgi:phosphate/sulfate permease
MTKRADKVAAVATGVGIGLMAFMVTWTVGARVTERMLERPTSAYVAMATAILLGLLVSGIAAWRLLRTVGNRIQEIDEVSAIAD